MRKLTRIFSILALCASLIACSAKQTPTPKLEIIQPSTTAGVVSTPASTTPPSSIYGHWDRKTMESCVNTGGVYQKYHGIQPNGRFGLIGPICSYGSMFMPYRIQPGDTLYEIGRKMGVPEKYLPTFTEMVLRANKGLDPKRMIPGDYIAVPTPDVVDAYIKGISP